MALQNSLEHLDDMGLDTRDEVVIGALISVVIEGGQPQSIILLPGGDATKLDCAGEQVTVLSANSPLARQLRDAEVDDILEVDLGGRVCELNLLSIA